MATCNANTLLQQAAANGFTTLDEGALDIVLTQLICDAIAGGGGGGAASVLVESGLSEKISAMGNAAALTGNELVALVQGGGNVKDTLSDVAAYVLGQLNRNPFTATQINLDDGGGSLLEIFGDGSSNYKILNQLNSVALLLNADGSVAIGETGSAKIVINSDGTVSIFDNNGSETLLHDDGSGGTSISWQDSGSRLEFTIGGGIGIYTNALGFFAIGDNGTAAINDANAAVGASDGIGNFTFNQNLTVDGILRLAGTISAPGTSTGAASTTYYGTGTNFLGTPNTWVQINVGGSNYKIPLYS